MTLLTNYYLIHNKPDGTKELLGLFNDQQVALDVRVDWNKDSGIPIHEMIVMERTEEFPLNEQALNEQLLTKENPIDNQE